MKKSDIEPPLPVPVPVPAPALVPEPGPLPAPSLAPGPDVMAGDGAGERAEDRLRALTLIVAREVADGLATGSLRPLRRALPFLCRLPARRFARKVLDYDDIVARQGLAAAARFILARFGCRLELEGAERIPRQGPLLVLANHPGLFDAMALVAAIDRPDLLVIAADRTFLRALTATRRHLLLLEESRRGHGAVLRACAQHLRAGGAILTFPAGVIEPDPASLPGAAAALEAWRPAVSLLARAGMGAPILPAILGGTLSPRALAHPLARLRRRPADRQWLAAFLQLQLPALQDAAILVRFSVPLVPSVRDDVVADVLAAARASIARFAPSTEDASPR